MALRVKRRRIVKKKQRPGKFNLTIANGGGLPVDDLDIPFTGLTKHGIKRRTEKLANWLLDLIAEDEFSSTLKLAAKQKPIEFMRLVQGFLPAQKIADNSTNIEKAVFLVVDNNLTGKADSKNPMVLEDSRNSKVIDADIVE